MRSCSFRLLRFRSVVFSLFGVAPLAFRSPPRSAHFFLSVSAYVHDFYLFVASSPFASALRLSSPFPPRVPRRFLASILLRRSFSHLPHSSVSHAPSPVWVHAGSSGSTCRRSLPAPRSSYCARFAPPIVFRSSSLMASPSSAPCRAPWLPIFRPCCAFSFSLPHPDTSCSPVLSLVLQWFSSFHCFYRFPHCRALFPPPFCWSFSALCFSLFLDSACPTPLRFSPSLASLPTPLPRGGFPVFERSLYPVFLAVFFSTSWPWSSFFAVPGCFGVNAFGVRAIRILSLAHAWASHLRVPLLSRVASLPHRFTLPSAVSPAPLLFVLLSFAFNHWWPLCSFAPRRCLLFSPHVGPPPPLFGWLSVRRSHLAAPPVMFRTRELLPAFLAFVVPLSLQILAPSLRNLPLHLVLTRLFSLF